MALSLRTHSALATRASRAQRLSKLAPQRVSLPVVQPRIVVRASEAEGTVDSEKILKDLQEKWDKVENKPQVAIYAGGAVFALWLTGTVIGAINNIPLLPKLLELVGLGYSAWFTYRYLLFKASREELIKDVEELKSKITGQ